jgi:predicted Zn-dependent protease
VTGTTDYADRLHSAAAAARERLENLPVARWEVFAKASFAREVALTPNHPLEVLNVEETGVAVRSFRAGKTGFAAASGLENDASRRAVEGALAIEAATAVDPLPPQRLLGITEVRAARTLPATGWATHTGEELSRALSSAGNGHLKLRRTILQEGGFAWILNTAEGWVARHEDTSTALLAEVEVVGDRIGVWRDWVHIPDPASFDVEAVAALIADRALLTRSRVSTDSGLRDLILHPEVSAQLLAAISPLFLATTEQDDQLGTILDRHGCLAARALSLVEDRTDPDAPITGPCDGEGLPAQRTLLLEEGIPRHRLASFGDSVRCSETPRGGALRLSYRDYPESGIANLQVATAAGVAAGELLGSADRALYLLRPLAPIDFQPDTDTYRIMASGVWLDGHRVRGWHPVVELRGSVGRLLRRIDAVGNDLRWFQTSRGFIGAPSLLVRRQPVVG